MVGGLGVNPQPFQSEHLPIGDTSNPVAYSLTSRTSLNAQPVQTVSSVRDLGLLLNTGFSAHDNVARATKKARGMLFYRTKRLFARTLNMQFKHPPHSLPGLPGARKCSKTRSEVCKGVAPCSIRDSPPAAAIIFPNP